MGQWYLQNFVLHQYELVDQKFHFCLNFSCYKQATFEKLKTFVQTLYDYNFLGTITEDNSDEEDEMEIGVI